jgi:hypothetical protein
VWTATLALPDRGETRADSRSVESAIAHVLDLAAVVETTAEVLS